MTSTNQVQIYIAQVVEINDGINSSINDKANWDIKFKIPGIMSDNIENNIYPTATCIFDHTNEVKKDDEVIIFRYTTNLSDTFFYLPIRIDNKVGLFWGNNRYDISKNGEIHESTSDLKTTEVGNTLLTQDGKNKKFIFSIDENVLMELTSSSLSINVPINVIGNLSVYGSISDTNHNLSTHIHTVDHEGIHNTSEPI